MTKFEKYVMISLRLLETQNLRIYFFRRYFVLRAFLASDVKELVRWRLYAATEDLKLELLFVSLARSRFSGRSRTFWVFEKSESGKGRVDFYGDVKVLAA